MSKKRVYQLKFNDPNYLFGLSHIICAEIEPENLTPEIAANIFYRTELQRRNTTNTRGHKPYRSAEVRQVTDKLTSVEPLPTGSIDERVAIEKFTIRNTMKSGFTYCTPPGIVYYVQPGDTTDVTILRTHKDGTTEVIAATVPEILYNRVANEALILRLFEQIIDDFNSSENLHITEIPYTFLTKYKVTLRQVQSTEIVRINDDTWPPRKNNPFESDTCKINPRPETWPNTLMSNMKITTYCVEYGQYKFNDENMRDLSKMTCLIRASIHEKLLSGKYTVSPESAQLTRLIIVDEQGRPVDPLGN